MTATAGAVILADATTSPVHLPTRTDLRHVLDRLPHPRKRSRSAVPRPSEAQESR